MAKSKLVNATEKVADTVIGGYKKVEEGVVGGYKKIENGVVGAYRKVEDGFVDQFLTREGETVEDAKKRLHEEQDRRESEAKEAAGKRFAGTPAGVHPGSDIGKTSLERSRETARASVKVSRSAGKK